jgi:hypothetical protein
MISAGLSTLQDGGPLVVRLRGNWTLSMPRTPRLRWPGLRPLARGSSPIWPGWSSSTAAVWAC